MDLEKLILGHFILRPDILNDTDANKQLFTSPDNRRIYEAIKSSNGDGDLVFLTKKLDGQVDAAYLTSLLDGVPKSDLKNTQKYIDDLRKDQLTKKLLSRIGSCERSGILPSWDELDPIISSIRELHLRRGRRGNIKPNLVCLSDVEPRPVEWLWYDRIPLGKLSMLFGDPGLGKSFIGIYMASLITTGRPWPDIGAPNLIGNVILLTAEDGLSDTVRIRADAMGADPARIHVIESVKTGQGKTEFFNLRDHLAALDAALRSIGDIRLVIIDPITAFLGEKLDSYKDSQTRAVLSPLAALAEEHNVSLLGIGHFNKNEAKQLVYRAMGSLAFTAAPRAAWGVSRKDPDDPSNRARLLGPIKTNLSINPTTLEFSIVDGRVEFKPDPVEHTIDTAMNPDLAKESRAVAEAGAWLMEELQDGPVWSKDVFKRGGANGHSAYAIRRAKDRLKIQLKKEGFGETNKWLWSLPETGTAH